MLNVKMINIANSHIVTYMVQDNKYCHCSKYGQNNIVIVTIMVRITYIVIVTNGKCNKLCRCNKRGLGKKLSDCNTLGQESKYHHCNKRSSKKLCNCSN